MEEVDVIVLLRENGKYYDHDRAYLSSFQNILPSFGDRLTLHLEEEGLATYEVVGRYFSEMIIDNFGNEGRYLVLVVEQIHEDEFFEFDATMRQIHAEEHRRRQPRGGGPEVERLGQWKDREKLDRNNRDPAYWTEERKQILQKEREARLAAIRAGQEPED